jgi:hypothetical protein
MDLKMSNCASLYADLMGITSFLADDHSPDLGISTALVIIFHLFNLSLTPIMTIITIIMGNNGVISRGHSSGGALYWGMKGPRYN